MHPIAFFSRKLSPAKQNNNVGNRELLAVKLALEEWRHWLEGSQQPFLVLTDHKNLEYPRKAKRINPWQACWALFFTRFHFTLSCWPGSNNGKADALSGLKSKVIQKDSKKAIFSPTHWINAIEWGFDKELENTLLRMSLALCRWLLHQSHLHYGEYGTKIPVTHMSLTLGEWIPVKQDSNHLVWGNNTIIR